MGRKLVLMVLLLSLSAAADLTGAEKTNLLGSWQYQGAGKDLKGVTSPDEGVFQFKSDGSLRYTVKSMGVNDVGKYELDGKTIKTVLDMFPGTYEIISIDKSKMVWKASIYYHFFKK